MANGFGQGPDIAKTFHDFAEDSGHANLSRNLIGCGLGLIGKVLDLAGDDRKSSACVACVGSPAFCSDIAEPYSFVREEVERGQLFVQPLQAPGLSRQWCLARLRENPQSLAAMTAANLMLEIAAEFSQRKDWYLPRRT